MKKRILIRAFTARRDTVYSELLAALLEKLGYEAMVCSLREYEFALRYWQPDAVVINARNKACRVKELCPNAKVVYLAGEGAEYLEQSDPYAWVNDEVSKLNYQAMDLICLWGQVSYDYCKKLLSEKDLEKIIVVGNPRLDIVSYLAETRKWSNTSNTLGLNCRFASINFHSGVSPLRGLLPGKEFQQRDTLLSLKSFEEAMKVVDHVLRNSSYKISLRPHPLEAIEPYYENIRPHFEKDFPGRVEIDGSFSVAHWSMGLRAILSPISTSVLETYPLGVPVINIDRLGATEELALAEAEASKDLQESTLIPDNFDEMYEMIQNPPNLNVNDTLDQLLTNFHNFPRRETACGLSAKAIAELLKDTPENWSFVMPKKILKLIDDYRFRKVCAKDRLHPNCNYKKGYHQLPNDFDKIVEWAAGKMQGMGRVVDNCRND